MEIFNSIEQIIIIYGPTLLMYVTQFVDWFVTLKKFRSLDINTQMAPVLSKIGTTASKMEKLEEDIRTFSEERLSLAESVKDLTAIIKAQNEEIKGTKEYLKQLSRENVELKAELRRKIGCEATEQENA